MRLLIYSGFNPRQRDNYGQTTLHLACINGNLTAVTELCEQVSLFHYLYLPASTFCNVLGSSSAFA